jgi:putative restriction endonuclease
MVQDFEWRARLATFDLLRDLGAPASEVSRSVLARGFELDGRRVSLVGPEGIWTPAGFRTPISITTSPSGPYTDRVDAVGNRIRYAYREGDPDQRANLGLRRALAEGTPLVYFFRTDPGHYLATFPVYIVADDRPSRAVLVKVDEAWAVAAPEASQLGTELQAPLRREYATRIVRQRLFQAEFRRRVVNAYRERCALCSLRHRELLDAAHITADSDPSGEPMVSNGMALCKLHHAAFDSFFFTVTPDYIVEVRPSILAESDGPMLIVGLQEIHGQRIQVPREVAQQPDPARLARRLEVFRQAP